MRKSSGIVPCTNKECGHPTRPSRVPAGDAPGTRCRRRGGICSKCDSSLREPKPKPVVIRLSETEIAEIRFLNTVSGLESFMAARRDRLSRYRLAA